MCLQSQSFSLAQNKWHVGFDQRAIYYHAGIVVFVFLHQRQQIQKEKKTEFTFIEDINMCIQSDEIKHSTLQP